MMDLSHGADVAMTALSEASMCEQDNRWGEACTEPFLGPIRRFGAEGITSDKDKVWMARTVKVKALNGDEKYILLPFLLNTGGHCLLGQTAWQALLDAGAREAESTISSNRVLAGVDLLLPNPSARPAPKPFLVPSGHWIDKDVDIRNNLIGGSTATIIVAIDVLSGSIVRGFLPAEDALAQLCTQFGGQPNDYRTELELQLKCKRDTSINQDTRLGLPLLPP